MAGRTSQARGAKRARFTEPAAPDLPDTLAAGTLPEAELSDGGLHAGLAVDDVDFSGRQVAGFEIDQCRYQGVSLSEVRLQRAEIKDAEFSGCDLANLRARESSMRRSAIRSTRMTGFTWITGRISDVVFDGARIDLAYFSSTRFSRVLFTSCRLEQANFGDTELTDVRFTDCDLTGAQFSGANLAQVSFTGCDLTGLAGVASLRGATITAADALTLAPVFAQALGITLSED
jgi:uncharacterized protein YjbI with pentapeptide repeats